MDGVLWLLVQDVIFYFSLVMLAAGVGRLANKLEAEMEERHCWTCPECREHVENLEKKAAQSAAQYEELEKRYQALMGCYQLSVAAGQGLRRVAVTAWRLLSGKCEEADVAARGVMSMAVRNDERPDCEPEGPVYTVEDLSWPV